MITRTEILLALQDALVCEIYCSIREIVFKYDIDKNSFLLRFYLDREVVEEDTENISNVMAEFISHFKYSEFDEILEECIYSSIPQSKLDTLSGVVYARKE